MSRRLTDADRDYARMLGKTYGLQRVAAITGISKSTLVHWRRQGMAFASSARIFPAGKHDEARELAADCATWAQLSQLTGVGPLALCRWAAAEGWGLGVNLGRLGGRRQGCITCKHPRRSECSQHWCACISGSEQEYVPPDVSFSWPKPYLYWWETCEPSPLVQAAQMLELR